jgi:hypothetical protein
LIVNRLYGVVSQKSGLFITSAVRITDPKVMIFVVAHTKKMKAIRVAKSLR